jgi:hypothetical protein
MRGLTWIAFVAMIGAGLVASAPKAEAQVGVEIGPAPVCPYGYYDVAPYDCAPYGYYGPDWFADGVFIGTGPWFHGPETFYGHVDNRLDRGHFHGKLPARGEHPSQSVNRMSHFHGNEMRDGHGHVQGHKR